MAYNPQFDPEAITTAANVGRGTTTVSLPGIGAVDPTESYRQLISSVGQGGLAAAQPQKRVGELINDEAMLGRIGLLQTVAGGGFLPGQLGQMETDVNRQLGLQSATERTLMNRRLAATPGLQDTGFGDALSRQFATGQQNALSSYLASLHQGGLERQYGALGQLFGSEREAAARRAQEKASKRAAWGGAISGLLSPIGQFFGQKGGDNEEESPSSIDFKRNIKDLDQNKIKQLLGSINKIDLKKFRYKPGIEDGGEMEKMGMLAEEAPEEVVTPDGRGVDMMSLIAMLIGSVQQISKELDLYKKFASRKKELEVVSKG